MKNKKVDNNQTQNTSKEVKRAHKPKCSGEINKGGDPSRNITKNNGITSELQIVNMYL